MDDWTERFAARGLVSNRSNRENEVADAALRSLGEGELWRVKKRIILAKERFCLLTRTFNG
jgi:hypothetical protein